MTAGPADIALARVYDPPGAEGRARLLVDRLWPRGIARAALAHDAWLREIAPSDALRRWFHAGPLDAARWAEFAARYRAELATRPEAVAQALRFCRQGPVTLLYAARERGQNHALVLRDYLLERLAGTAEAAEAAEADATGGRP